MAQSELTLYLMRHGKAEPHGESDAARRLTPDGVARLVRQAPGMQRLGIQPDTIIASPRVRAQMTAEVMAGGLKAAPHLTETALGECLSAAGAVRIAERAGRPRVMLVGHNPDISDIPGDLVGSPITDLKPGGVAIAVRGTDGHWTLAGVYQPDQLMMGA